MSDHPAAHFTAFAGHRRVASGALAEVAVALSRRTPHPDAVLVFDDGSGQVVDLDLRGSEADIVARLPPLRPAPGAAQAEAAQESPRGRGRPRLGVLAREVTLLPRQWEWLAAQPGGASATLRKLVEEARRTVDPRRQRRAAQETTYRVMQALGGDLPGYEEATRALFAGDLAGLRSRIADWPADVRDYALRLAAGAGADAG